MRPRARAHAITASRPGWLIPAGAALVLLTAAAAHAQSGPVASDAVPSASSPAAPAEIQPGHPAPATADASGPQSAVPAPLPPGARADTPGGSARNGVIAPPPAAGDHDINKGAPGAAALGTPVIRPPGSPGGDTRVIPK
jgi:hypothetical protein